VWWDIKLLLYQKFTAKSASERIFENCLAFANLQVKVEWLKRHFLSQLATQ